MVHTSLYLGHSNQKHMRKKIGILLRLDPEVHAILVELARKNRMSINRVVTELILRARENSSEVMTASAAGQRHLPDSPRPLAEALSELAELQEGDFEGFTTSDLLTVFMNKGLVGSIAEARSLLGRLLASRAVTCRVRGKEVRYYINANFLDAFTETPTSSRTPSAPHRRTSQPDRPSPGFSF